MKVDIKAIYSELKTGIDQKRLKDITVDIITRYKEKDVNKLSWYAALLGIDTSDVNPSRLFSRIIQNYHPDKFEKIINDIENHYKNDNVVELLRIRKIYLFNESSKKKFVDINNVEAFFFDKEPGRYYESELLDDEIVLDDEYDNIFDEYVFEQEYGFIEAVNNHFFGNLNHFIAISELLSLEGELDLSDYDIVDLKGIENCLNVSSLNLSGNRLEKITQLSGLKGLESLYIAENSIEDIGCLSGLANLIELDVSFNEIRDISVLMAMTSLKYVNLLGNPFREKGIIAELTNRGIIVIY